VDETKKQQLALEKKQFSLKIMYFNRYLVIRYLTAFFFFINLNWLVLLLIARSSAWLLPLSLLALIVPAIGEQVILYRTHTNRAPWTSNYFKIQGMMNVGISGLLLTPWYRSFFPFMSNDHSTKLFLLALFVSGIFVCGFCWFRLEKIERNQDRQYQRVKQYEKISQLGKGSN